MAGNVPSYTSNPSLVIFLVTRVTLTILDPMEPLQRSQGLGLYLWFVLEKCQQNAISYNQP